MDNQEKRYKELGDFLKTRRAKISPGQVGLQVGSRRRTPGLRREEVSMLSGIGLTWYTWIEQGRQLQISPQVLESLARTLLLDKQEIVHIYNLAQQTPPTHFQITDTGIHPMLQHVLNSFEIAPATILDARWNVIAWNEAAAAIVKDYASVNADQRNIVRIMFTDIDFMKTVSNWEKTAQSMVGRFRTTYGKLIGDPWIEAFIQELSRESKVFSQWWQMQDVDSEEEITKVINHAAIGELKFEYTSFQILSDTNLKMTVLTPLPGSGSAEKIKEYLTKGL